MQTPTISSFISTRGTNPTAHSSTSAQQGTPSVSDKRALSHKGVINYTAVDSVCKQFTDQSSGDLAIAKILYDAANFDTQSELNGLLKSNPQFSERINQNVTDILFSQGLTVRKNHNGLVKIEPNHSHADGASGHDTLPNIPSKVISAHAEVSKGEHVILEGEGASADVFHHGVVNASGKGVNVNVRYSGFAYVLRSAKAEVTEGGKAHAADGGNITLREGAIGLVTENGTADAFDGSVIQIYDGGAASLFWGSKGTMNGKGKVTVNDGAELIATAGKATINEGGWGHGTKHAELTILSGGNGRIGNNACATVRTNGSVTVENRGRAFIANGGVGTILSGGSATVADNTNITVHPGATVQFLDPDMSIDCNGIIRKVSDLKNYVDGSAEFIEITAEDCASASLTGSDIELVQADQGKQLKSAIKKEQPGTQISDSHRRVKFEGQSDSPAPEIVDIVPAMSSQAKRPMLGLRSQFASMARQMEKRPPAKNIKAESAPSASPPGLPKSKPDPARFISPMATKFTSMIITKGDV